MTTNHCLKYQWVKTVQFHAKFFFFFFSNLSYQRSKICGSVHSNKNVICLTNSVKNPIIKLKISLKSSLLIMVKRKILYLQYDDQPLPQISMN